MTRSSSEDLSEHVTDTGGAMRLAGTPSAAVQDPPVSIPHIGVKEFTMSKDLVTTEDKIKDLAALAVEEGNEEHLSQEELELPFLRVAQKGSPQVDDAKPEYIDGLKPGQYFNTVSSTNYGDTLMVQVHGYFHNYLIWKGEKGNGDYGGTLTPEEFREYEKTHNLTRDGGDMVEYVDGEEIRYSDTRNFIVSLPEHEEDGIMIYPLSSTGIKAARKWNTLQQARRINGRPAKRYATIWEISTAGFEKNGFTWKQTSNIKPVGWATGELVEFGRAFEDFVSAIKEQGVKYSEGTESEEGEDSDF
jgi:hypothetical protein